MKSIVLSSISPGEVFVLLTRLNEEWGWGRSQRTGESGLIPFVVMEEVVQFSINVIVSSHCL